MALWRDVSLMLLVLEAAVIIAPVLVVGYYVLKGLRRLRAWLAEQFPLWRGYVDKSKDIVTNYATLLVTPVVAAVAVLAAIGAVARVLSPHRQETEEMPYYDWF